jgi:hypothetical protein
MTSQLNKQNTIKVALLTAMYFNRPMRRTELDYLTYGFAVNQSALITNLLKENKIEKVKNLDEEYKLTKRGLNQVNDTFIELIHKKGKGEKQIKHNLAISRAILLIMLTFPKSEIIAIKKEKDLDSSQTPDLTIELKNQTYNIEVDTGTQAVKVLQNKISNYRVNNVIPIFLTKSTKTYNELKDNKNCRILQLDDQNLFKTFSLTISNLSNRQDKISEGLNTLTTLTTTDTTTPLEPSHEERKAVSHETILERMFGNK